MKRVLQISDTHLSASKPHFATNWAPLAAWTTAQKPDLIIHTGDVTVDGADVEDDFAYCAALMKELPAQVRAVPGNHDVGEAHHPHQPVNAERIARWRRHFGSAAWAHDLEEWRLIGFDSMLAGSGLHDEEEQFDWLSRQSLQADGRRIAWFTHRPLFIEAPDEGDTGYWSMRPAPRAKFLDLAQRANVALVATGHLHKSHDDMRDGCRFIWGGAAGFVVGPAHQPPMPGETLLGAVVYEFDGPNVTAARADVPGLTTLWIDDVIHEVYPPRPAA